MAQSVEQLICNLQVLGSSPFTSSRKKHLPREQVLFLPYFVFFVKFNLVFL